ncbi:MAG TPA: bifunctional aspartate kinase/homoserine dehydrogenase I [Bacteroidota bacterium]|nr:bifunctional aspartate kinase/homoserine dehydrogenase I [Bacteroidota bacterium]
MRVMKFGGSSVGTPGRIREVIRIILQGQSRHQGMVVVFSAFEGVTDQLIATGRLAARGDRKYVRVLSALKRRHLGCLNELVSARRRRECESFVRDRLTDLSDVLHGVFFTKELTTRTLDYVMSFGEILSTSIIAEAARERGLACKFYDSRQMIKADDTFGNGRVKYDLTYRNIRSHLRRATEVQFVPGFIASTTDNDTVTLGRGGSDFSAALYGAAAGAREIEIWTDVDGVMTADPRKVSKAFSIPSMTFDEAMEMSHFGAKVINPPTMLPALERNIPIRIKNTFHPEFPGTVIGKRDRSGAFPIKGISSIDEIALLRIQGSGLSGSAGIGKRIFSALATKNINVLMVTQASSEYSLCLAVLPDSAAAAKHLIEEELKYELRDRRIEAVVIESGLSAVAIVGENMRKTTGVSGKLFQALGKNGINVVAIAQGSSELNISTIVAKDDEAKALNTIHDAFFLSGTKSLHLFIVGTGLIGGTLLKQIAQQKQVLLRSQSLDIRVQAVANSRQMIFDGGGSLPQHWRERLEGMGTPMNLDSYIRQMKGMNLANSVFVDCTASDELVAKYAEVLESSISIVTPNKKANAGRHLLYARLHRAAMDHNVRFLYETNVGAGLPIINTINDLVAGGDRIERIDGVLSGTLSYLFNSFVDGRSFSEIVREAKMRGYTEPDPRDDLNGRDVARKLLILARESGHLLELRDVRVKSLIPTALLRQKSIDGFFKHLKTLDPDFSRERVEAETEGKVLRYVASFADGEAEVAVQRVGPDHPCYALSGSDILVALTTTNCRDHPIVIKGPGAGAEVTATGVFADIIRIAHHQG